MHEGCLCLSFSHVCCDHVQTFLAVVGYLMSDVMCDAMVVERARYEDAHLKGEMQVRT